MCSSLMLGLLGVTLGIAGYVRMPATSPPEFLVHALIATTASALYALVIAAPAYAAMSALSRPVPNSNSAAAPTYGEHGDHHASVAA
jgi:hypothetical protein